MFDNKLSFRTRFPCLNSVQFNRAIIKTQLKQTQDKHTHVTIKCLILDNLSTNITINDIKLISCRAKTINWYVCRDKQ